jgi:flagellar protein FlgJ
MLRLDSIATRPLAATEPLRPRAATGGASAGLYGEVRAEVEQFIEDGAVDASPVAPMPAFDADVAPAAAPTAAPARQQAFVSGFAPAAEAAAERLGVAPELVLAHAALESGWGQRPLLGANGADSHNLFGIKAGAGWRGAVARATTTEIENGQAVKKTEPFRSYPDAAGAFDDYTRVLLENPRFRGALGAGGDARAFAEGLARGGYATDPAYASKLARVAAQLQSRD